MERTYSEYEDLGIYRCDGARITNTGLFKDVTEKDILFGLEKAVKKLSS